MRLEEVILRGTRADQPSFLLVPVGTLYCVTDESDIVERNSGAAWESFSPTASSPAITQLTGDVTAGPGSGSQVATIAANAVTPAKMATVATARFLGRITAGIGNVEALTGTQATTLLDTFTSLLKGLAPASGGGTTNFLRADGTWAPTTGAWTTITKSVDQTKTTDTTIADDSELLFAMLANTTYRFRGRVYINYTAAGFFQSIVNGPAVPTYVSIHSNEVLTGGSSAFNETNALSYAAFANFASGSSGYIEFDGIVINGANAGNLAFRWAQIVASGSATVKKGSWLEYSSL